MGSYGSCNFDKLKDLKSKIDNLEQKKVEEFMEACAKELAARLLAKAIKRTPVGQYPSGSGKVGGTLRRGWTAGKIKMQQLMQNLYKFNILVMHIKLK